MAFIVYVVYDALCILFNSLSCQSNTKFWFLVCDRQRCFDGAVLCQQVGHTNNTSEYLSEYLSYKQYIRILPVFCCFKNMLIGQYRKLSQSLIISQLKAFIVCQVSEFHAKVREDKFPKSLQMLKRLHSSYWGYWYFGTGLPLIVTILF